MGRNVYKKYKTCSCVGCTNVRDSNKQFSNIKRKTLANQDLKEFLNSDDGKNVLFVHNGERKSKREFRKGYHFLYTG